MHRTVADLRPRPGLALDPSVSVAAAARKMSAAGVDSGLIVSSDGQLQGILTDTDVACKRFGPRRGDDAVRDERDTMRGHMPKYVWKSNINCEHHKPSPEWRSAL